MQNKKILILFAIALIAIVVGYIAWQKIATKRPPVYMPGYTIEAAPGVTSGEDTPAGVI